MVIVSQSGNCVADVTGGYVDIRNKSIHAAVRNAYLLLGAYPTEERTSEVLKDIITSISSGQAVFEMPDA